MRPFLFALFFLCIHELKAQCPSTNFSVPASACINQRITPTNLSTGEVAYEWDFCSGDLENDPTASGIITNAFLVRGRSFRIVYSSTGWYGFSIDQANNILLRFDFGLTPSAIPTVTNLGNPGGVLKAVFDFELYSESGNWYALVVNSSDNTIVKLTFGSSLDSPPEASSVVSLPDGPRGIALVNDQGNLHAFITTLLTSTVTRLDFGNTINNTPQVTTIVVPSSINLRGISFIKQCNSWFAAVTDYNQNLVYLLNFSAGITNSPTSSIVSTGSVNLNFPASISLQVEGGKYFALIQSAIGNLYRLSFGDSLSASIQASKDFGNFGISDNFSLAVGNSESNWWGFSIDNTTGRLIRLSFPSLCSGNAFISTQPNPTFQYTNSGSYLITLRSFDSSGNSSSSQQTILVSSQQAPDIDFTTQYKCVNAGVDFKSINNSGNISSYYWNFGNGFTSTSPTPTTLYSLATTYPVTLEVAAANGCTNATKSDVVIYNQPFADFVLPTTIPICTHQEYVISNSSTFDLPSNPTWEWRLNGVLVSNVQDLMLQFSSASAQEIRLKAIIPGCENEMVKNISSVQEGPQPDFTFSNSCQLTPVSFTNATSGSVTDYSWNFGDGNISSQQNGINSYANSGLYQVTLQATNASGCQNFVTKPITIYSAPQPNFSLDLPPFSCVGSPSQFNDLTPPLTDSNITSRLWTFGDTNNGTSIQANPTYTYNQAGDYQVSLDVTSNFGCSNTIQKTITIQPSPTVSFTNTPACLNQPTQFTDASGADVKAWLWSIQNSSYTTKNVTHAFSTTGLQNAILTVTGNNNCVSQISKAITIPVPVSIDFTSQGTCATKPAVFTEANSGGVDPAVTSTWDFAGQPGSGSPVLHVFSSVGSYPVKLNSTRLSGCVYSVTKSVNIVQPPVARFTMTPENGGPPLKVDFTNTSISATNYIWNFNDSSNSTSVQFSPSFVFDQLGTYAVELIASNASGCTDSLKKEVQVVVPQINAVLSGFRLTSNADGTLNAIVTVENKGNITIINPEVYLDLSGITEIKERISGTIPPNQSITRTLTSTILPNKHSYACAEVFITGDSNAFDNRECTNLESEIVFIQPYPNPANDIIYLDWINENLDSLQVIIYNSSGQAVLNQTYSNLMQGLNQVEINVSQLAPGIYLASYSTGNIPYSFRFSVIR